MKKYLLGLIVCVFALSITGCSKIDDMLDEHLNYTNVTIEYDYNWHSSADYKNLKVIFDEKEYTAVGTYKVLKESVINLSWSYGYWDGIYAKVKWGDSSENVSVGTNKKMTIRISGSEVHITND